MYRLWVVLHLSCHQALTRMEDILLHLCFDTFDLYGCKATVKYGLFGYFEEIPKDASIY